jgi:hypothetical protein
LRWPPIGPGLPSRINDATAWWTTAGGAALFTKRSPCQMAARTGSRTMRRFGNTLKPLSSVGMRSWLVKSTWRCRMSFQTQNGHHGPAGEPERRRQHLRAGKISLNANTAPRAQASGCFCFSNHLQNLNFVPCGCAAILARSPSSVAAVSYRLVVFRFSGYVLPETTMRRIVRHQLAWNLWDDRDKTDTPVRGKSAGRAPCTIGRVIKRAYSPGPLRTIGIQLELTPDSRKISATSSWV